jgi:ABC-type sugar transport system substrate-binding protein
MGVLGVPYAMGLGGAGRALWQRVTESLAAEGGELDDRQREVLALAARQADDLARLENAIRRHGAMVAGPAGEPTVNPALAEAREARIAIGRLLGVLTDPDRREEHGPKAGFIRQAQTSAHVRWDGVERRRQHHPA